MCILLGIDVDRMIPETIDEQFRFNFSKADSVHGSEQRKLLLLYQKNNKTISRLAETGYGKKTY